MLHPRRKRFFFRAFLSLRADGPLRHVEDIGDYDIIHPYDEDELIEDGLYFTFLDLDVDDLDKLYGKAKAIVDAAPKFILAIS